MKKRVISIFLCLCMLAGLLPSGVLAADDSTLEMIYATSIPADYSGMVLSLEKPTATNGTQLYAVSIGMYNTPASGAYSVNLEYDKTVLRLANATGGNALNWSAATADEKYISEMLEDPSNDEYGLLTTSLTDTQGMGMFTRSIPSGSESQKNISYSMNVSAVGDLSALIKNLTTDPARYTPPENTLVNLGTVYFKLQTGKTDADVTSSSIKLFPDPTDNRLASGAASIAGSNTTTTGALMLNFPAPPEEAVAAMISVNNTVAAAKEGVTLSITGKSEQGVDIKDQPEAQTSVVTDKDGNATVKLFPGEYTVSAADKTVGEDTYSSNGITASLSVSKGGTNSASINMTKVETLYPVNIRLVDKAGNPIEDTTGASLTFTGATPTLTGSSASFNVSSCNGTKVITLSGVPGYQNIGGSAINVVMTATGKNTATFTVTKGNDIAKVKNDGTTDYIELTLEPTVTKVKIPVPVPENTTKEDAENLTVTFTKGNETITVDTKVTDNGDGTFTVTAEAPLPDGTYDMTVGGAGFDPKSQPVTVITGPDGKTVVNVGGTATEENGTTTVTGGVTAVVDHTDGSKQDDAGNNLVDLTPGGDELQKDATVTVGGEGSTTETTTPGETVTGGLLGDETIAGNLTPSIMDNRVYEVETELHKYTGQESYEWLEAKVYLKNAEAAAGTFGMWYDKNLLELPTGSTNVVTVNDALGLTLKTGTEFQENSDEYVYFYWNKLRGTGSETEVNATAQKQLIATIRLNVKGGDAQTKLHKNMLKALAFTETTYGQGVMDLPADDPQDRYELLSAYWRHKSNVNGASNFNKEEAIDAQFADGDGFYQIAHTDPEGDPNGNGPEQQSYDIRIQFKLPKEVEKTSAQFWVREDANSTGIKGAKIVIYSDAEKTTEVDTVETDENGRATVILDPGTYFYSITHATHWDYPTGEAVNPGFTLDQFELKADGSIAMATLTLPDSDATWTTQTSVNTITPFMLPKTQHQVSLANKDDEAALSNLTISSSTTAYNSVPYYFTLQPGPGWKWIDKDMNKVAEKLSATLYKVDPEGADDTAIFHTQKDTLTPPKTEEGADQDLILWSAEKEQFYINATIHGDAYGKGEDPQRALRAGDLVILVEKVEELIEQAEYEITATAGKGGTMQVTLAEGSTPDVTQATLVGGQTDIYTGLSTVIEKLKAGGTTSGTYVFTPDTDGYIDKVIINGVAQYLTAEETQKPFTYTFQNVTGNESIYVTFLDKNKKPMSDANLTVTVGDHGGVTVAAEAEGIVTPTPGTVTGPDSATYTLPQSKTDDTNPDNPVTTTLTKLELTITPEEGYEIDKVLVNGTPKDLAADLGVTAPAEGATTGNSGKLTLTDPELAALLKQGETNSVVVTFKPFGEDSTQAIVTALVKEGSGTLSPAGVTIYALGSTPTYSMTPGGGEWLLDTEKGAGSIMLYADNVTPADETGTDASDKATAPETGHTYTYQLPALESDMRLEITFSEKTYAVNGLIQTVHNNSTGGTAALEAATLTFVRKSDGKKLVLHSDTTPSRSADATLSFGDDVKVPMGTWTVTFSKQGYLDHTIKEFSVDGSGAITFGATADSAAPKPVILIPGDAAGDGIAVAVNDASTVVAGWLQNASARNRKKGDIDESDGGGNSGQQDMTLVTNNMSTLRKSQTYSDFCSNGSNTKKN